MSKLYKSRAWLQGEVNKGKSIAEIAKNSGATEMTIRRWLHTHKIGKF